MKNITLSAEEYLIDGARKKARAEHKSLNALFREWLKRFVQSSIGSDEYRLLMKRCRYSASGGKYSRDEMNER